MVQTTKRKQHYVPKFYLKQFSSDYIQPESRRINLYNIPGNFLVNNASIKDQCYKDWIYGHSGTIENALQKAEGKWASLLKQICASMHLPDKSTPEHPLLLLFISIQKLRTERQGKEHENLSDLLVNNIKGEKHNFDNSMLENLRLKFGDAVSLNLQLSELFSVCLLDLKMQLLKATLNTEFVTSDNPVFSYNLYCEGFRIGTTGAAKSGLLIFLPLSPELCLLLYDGGIYKVGKPNNPNPIICNFQDVQMINALQFVGADANLYFSGGIPTEYFQAFLKRYKKARQEAGPRIVEAEEVGNPLSSLIQQYFYVPDLPLRLSFLSIRRDARRVPPNKRMNSYRIAPHEFLKSLPNYQQDMDYGLGDKKRTFVVKERPMRRK